MDVCGDIESNPGPSTKLLPSSSSSQPISQPSPLSQTALGFSSKSTISAVLFNARSIVNKLLLFQTELDVYKLDLAFITESWLDNSIHDGELTSNCNYAIFRKDRNRHGGGVFITIAKHLSPVRKYEFEHVDLELIMVDIHTKHGKVLLGCLYRPPSATVKFFEDYQSVLENILAFSQQYVAIAILGDFNIDFKVSTNNSHIQSSSVQRLHNISDILNLQQLVTFTYQFWLSYRFVIYQQT